MPLDVGTTIHGQVQVRLGQEFEGYQAEVSLAGVVSCDTYDIRLRGRCDGEFSHDGIILEEIKSSFGLAALQRSLDSEPDHPYILQLKVYAFLFRLKKGFSTRIQLRLVDSRSLEEAILPLDYDHEVFTVWVNSRVKQVEEQLERYRALVKNRRRLASRLFFPFTRPRPNQTELVDSVRSALTAGRMLLLQAPTGLGKTAGVLFPSLQHAMSKGAPLVYVAPKNSQFKAAIDLAKMFQKNRVPLKVLVLTSKTKACQADRTLCQTSSCPLAVNYYDKVGKAGIKQRDKKNHLWDYRYFQKLAETFEVCPYELGMERIPEADLIICDYNYIFSPRANLLDRYRDPIVPMKKPYLVIDEAHNLYERVMENYSPEIRLSSLNDFFDSCLKTDDQRFARVIQRAIGLMAILKPRATHACVAVEREAVQLLLDESVSVILSRWGEAGLPTLDDPLFQFYSQWSDLHSVTELADTAIPLIYKREDGDEILKAQCLDPHTIIAPLYVHFQGVVAFSATLKPFEFYRRVSGFSPDTSDAVEFTSPFPRAHKKIMIIPQVETSYRERSRHYGRIASIISRIAALEAGPYLVFFSSYSFLREVEKLLPEDLGFQIFAQSGSLSEDGVRSMHKRLQDNDGTTLVLAVQGGSLSEGIDFKGLGLRGVFIVGPAVPSASFERKLMQEHFAKLEGLVKGRSYAYVYPAMTRSVQAAGRIVRDEDERGIIVLLDPRFLEASFQETMPSDWYTATAAELVSEHILAEILSFWEESKKPLALTDEGPTFL